MHGCELSGRNHGSKCVIHMLRTGLIGSQKAEGGQITCGDERSERCVIRGAEEFGLGRVASEGDCVRVAPEEVLEVRFPFRTLQAAPQLVELAQLQKAGAVSEARAVVRGPAVADSKAVTELGELEEVFARSEAGLEVGDHHQLAAPRGFDSKDAKDLRRSLEGGLRSVCLHDKQLASIRRQVNAHGAERAQERMESCTVLHCKERLKEEE
eukprot:3302624-Pleurochrysis_carterae.AAC.5